MFARIALSIVAACGTILASPARAQTLKVLILSGRNNHDWKTTTPALQKVLDDSKLFACTVTNEPQKMTADLLSGYDLIVSNWNNWPKVNQRDWGKQAEDAFLDFVRQGKGVVMIHSASSAMYSWPEFQELVGTWWKLGQTGHGPVHKFAVRIADKSHPITAGLEDFETADELWHRMGTAGKLTVLAEAMSDKAKGGSGQVEPILHVRELGKGRCANLLLGHDARCMGSEGFKALLVRSAQWAATGKVSAAAKGAKGPAGEKNLTGRESAAELAEAAAGADAGLAGAAVEALKAKAGPGDVYELAELLSRVRAAAHRKAVEALVVELCLKNADADQRARPVLQGLPGASLAGRCSLLRVLGKLGGRQAREAIEIHLNHFDPTIRAGVMGMMLAWPGREFAPQVLRIACQKDKAAAAALAVRAWCRMTADMQTYDAAQAAELLRKAQAQAAGAEEKQALEAAIEAAGLSANYAMLATASSPDDLDDDGASVGDQGAIDGSLATYWDEQDRAKLYVLQLDWAHPVRVRTLRIVGWGHHDFAPKDFDVLCDSKTVKQIRNAQYKSNCLTFEIEPTACSQLQLRITGYYGNSPAVRELEVFDEGKLPPEPRFNVAFQGQARSLLSIREKADSGGPGAAIDDDENTWWAQEDGRKLYRLEVQFQRTLKVSGLRIIGLAHHAQAPKDFQVLCDGKAVKEVKNAQYDRNVLDVELAATSCKAIELRITGCYGGSPGIRELQVFAADQ